VASGPDSGPAALPAAAPGGGVAGPGRTGRWPAEWRAAGVARAGRSL